MAFNFSLGKKDQFADGTPAADTTLLDLGSAAPPAASPPTAALRPVADRLRRLGVAFGALALLTTGLVVYQGRESANATAHVAAVGEMQMLSQQIAKSAQLALRGDAAAFAELEGGRTRFASLLGALEQGGDFHGVSVPAVPAALRERLDAVAETWRITAEDSGRLLAERQNLVALNAAVAKINQADTRLLALSEQLPAAVVQGNGSAADIATASRAVMLTQRIAKNANALLVADAIDPENAFAFGSDGRALDEALGQLQRAPAGAEARARIGEFAVAARGMLDAVAGIVDGLQSMVQAKQAGSLIIRDAGPLLGRTNALGDGLNDDIRGFKPTYALIAITALLALLVLLRMVRAYNGDLALRGIEADRQRRSAEDERNLTQQAILRLMNEMGDLADGDLTVRATVSEDITGAIADSVNYTIEELSVLVRRINDAAGRVTAATESAQLTSAELLEATERQSREIENAGTTVEQMAQTMTESSERALQSAQVARRSLDSARKGAAAVENTIRGMNGIRTKIQETSKRIKRLGESSQEIGEIVELISDITEQTNVLALNAAIQAASAGEAGRGFTVVAEEVQRLAERSAEATKQIAAIVKTIQTDTQDAVGAMEYATRDVVEGAQLSDAAGQALAEIGAVSTETARLIERISADTQQQATTAGRVAATMRDILAITERTTLGTKQTAVSVGQLSDLAAELKGSVSGFKV
jgi:twitching motility protein PilJ